jgi:hypothetical protein
MSKSTVLIVVTIVGLTAGLLERAYAAAAGSIDSAITIQNNHATTVRDTGGIGFELKGVTKKLIGIEMRQGHPDRSETVVQGVRHNGSLPADQIKITENEAHNITNMGGRLTVQGVSMAYAASAGSKARDITIHQNTAKDVIDTGGLGVGFTGAAKWFLGTEGRMGNPNSSETVVQGVRHNGSLPAGQIMIQHNEARNIMNMGGRLTVQGVSVYVP